jgi:hypothetical protein
LALLCPYGELDFKRLVLDKPLHADLAYLSTNPAAPHDGQHPSLKAHTWRRKRWENGAVLVNAGGDNPLR